MVIHLLGILVAAVIGVSYWLFRCRECRPDLRGSSVLYFWAYVAGYLSTQRSEAAAVDFMMLAFALAVSANMVYLLPFVSLKRMRQRATRLQTTIIMLGVAGGLYIVIKAVYFIMTFEKQV